MDGGYERVGPGSPCGATMVQALGGWGTRAFAQHRVGHKALEATAAWGCAQRSMKHCWCVSCDGNCCIRQLSTNQPGLYSRLGLLRGFAFSGFAINRRRSFGLSWS